MSEIHDPVVVSRTTLETLRAAALFQHREITSKHDPKDPYRDLLTIELLDMAIAESRKALRIKAGLYDPDTSGLSW